MGSWCLCIFGNNTILYAHNLTNRSMFGSLAWCLKEYPSLKDECDGIAFHYYHGTIEQTAFLKNESR